VRQRVTRMYTGSRSGGLFADRVRSVVRRGSQRAFVVATLEGYSA